MHQGWGLRRRSSLCVAKQPSDLAYCAAEERWIAFSSMGEQSHIVPPCCGEEAVGYSLYHHQSAWREDALQNLCLLTSNSFILKFKALHRCALTAGGEGAICPCVWSRVAFLVTKRLLDCYDLYILKASRRKKTFCTCGELDFKGTRAEVIC